MRYRITRFLESLWYGRNPLALLLWPLGYAYALGAQRRRARYLRGLAPVIGLPVPVIVAGNITVGGTGKTPLIVWLAAALQRRGFRPGIVSRGYRGRATDRPRSVFPDSDAAEVGDEPVLIARRTGCPVVVAADRVAAARQLLTETAVDVLLADDGLQHYRLGRQFEIAVVDGERGLGNGWCLPAGPLREPPGRLRAVDAIVVNGGGWRPEASQRDGDGEVLRARLVATRVYPLGGECERGAGSSGGQPLSAFAGRQVHAVAGIGHPQRFFALLREAGIDAIPHPRADHAGIAAADLDFAEPGAVLMTEKDAVKYRGIGRGDVGYVAVELCFEGDHGERLIERVIDAVRSANASASANA